MPAPDSLPELIAERRNGEPLVGAHRGGATYAPENTLAAFAEGIRRGAQMLELDIHLSREGEVVVRRTQFDLHCTSSSGYTYTATWFTGPIAGHPWEVDLVAAKLDTLPGHDEYAWGRTMYDSSVTFFGCFNDPELLSARQVGNTLSLVNYGSNEVIDCQFTLFKQP